MASFSVIGNMVHIEARNEEQTIWRIYTRNCATLFRCITELARIQCNITETQEDVPVRYGDRLANYAVNVDANLNQIHNLIRIINEIDNNITTENRIVRIGRWNEYYENNLATQRRFVFVPHNPRNLPDSSFWNEYQNNYGNSR